MPTQDGVTQDKERVTQYERGQKDATEKFALLLSLCIDFYPAGPSAQTLTRIGADRDQNAALVEDILGELKRFRAAEVGRKSGKAAAPEAVA